MTDTALAEDLTTEYTEEDKRFDFVVNVHGEPVVHGPFPTRRAARAFAGDYVNRLVERGAEPESISYRVDAIPEPDAPPAASTGSSDVDPATLHLPPDPPVGTILCHDLPVDDGIRYLRGEHGYEQIDANSGWGRMLMSLPELLVRAHRAGAPGLRIVTADEPEIDPVGTVRARPGDIPILVIRSDRRGNRNPWRVFASFGQVDALGYSHTAVTGWRRVPLDELATHLGHPATPAAR